MPLRSDLEWINLWTFLWWIIDISSLEVRRLILILGQHHSMDGILESTAITSITWPLWRTINLNCELKYIHHLLICFGQIFYHNNEKVTNRDYLYQEWDCSCHNTTTWFSGHSFRNLTSDYSYYKVAHHLDVSLPFLWDFPWDRIRK